MEREHRIRITWSPATEAAGLPTFERGVDPSWLAGTEPGEADAWSLVYRFDRPPSEQGNPSEGHARFLMDDAPTDWLRPGRQLRLFERVKGRFALVDVLD